LPLTVAQIKPGNQQYRLLSFLVSKVNGLFPCAAVQTLAGCCSVKTISEDCQVTTEQLCSETHFQNECNEGFSKCYREARAAQPEQLGSWLERTGPAATYLACADMIRYATNIYQQLASLYIDGIWFAAEN
jgi:hypothetical protein